MESRVWACSYSTGGPLQLRVQPVLVVPGEDPPSDFLSGLRFGDPDLLVD